MGSELVHGSDNDSDELVEVDFPVSVEIEGFEQVFLIFIINIDLEIADAFLELVEIQSASVVIVHDFELSPEPNHTPATPALELVPEPLHKHGLELGGRLGVLDDH